MLTVLCDGCAQWVSEKAMRIWLFGTEKCNGRSWPVPGRASGGSGAGLCKSQREEPAAKQPRLWAGKRSDKLSWLIGIHTDRERKLPRSSTEAAKRGMDNHSSVLPLLQLSQPADELKPRWCDSCTQSRVTLPARASAVEMPGQRAGLSPAPPEQPLPSSSSSPSPPAAREEPSFRAPGESQAAPALVPWQELEVSGGGCPGCAPDCSPAEGRVGRGLQRSDKTQPLFLCTRSALVGRAPAVKQGESPRFRVVSRWPQGAWSPAVRAARPGAVFLCCVCCVCVLCVCVCCVLAARAFFWSWGFSLRAR